MTHRDSYETRHAIVVISIKLQQKKQNVIHIFVTNKHPINVIENPFFFSSEIIFAHFPKASHLMAMTRP